MSRPDGARIDLETLGQVRCTPGRAPLEQSEQSEQARCGFGHLDKLWLIADSNLSAIGG